MIRNLSCLMGSLYEASNDVVSSAADTLASDLMDVSRELELGDFTTIEAHMIASARIDTFIYETLHPWMSRKYGMFDEESLMLANRPSGLKVMGDA